MQEVELNKRETIRFELIGAVFMVVSGSALHFAFEWSGNWGPLAVFAAVNESIWEHLKLAFWPGVVWGVCGIAFAGQSPFRVYANKGISLFLTAVLIVVVFKAYTSVLGSNMLILDIATFAFAILAGQVFSAGLAMHASEHPRLMFAGSLFATMQLIAYSTLSYFPPPFWLFIESSTGQIGIPG